MGTGLPTGFDPVGVAAGILVFVIVMAAIIWIVRPAISRRTVGE